jgi:peptide chain release factor 1
MRKELDDKLKRFEELERMMSDPAVLADSSKMAAIAREHGTLAKLATRYRSYRKILEDIAGLRQMQTSPDADERELAEGELPVLLKQREADWNELLDLTAGGKDDARDSCVIELRAGTGGEEAALFARDLAMMYERYCSQQGWSFQLIDVSPGEAGGYKEATASIEGEGCFRALQYESGGHRVQRVPETETKGRIHTSAATVAVMAEPEDVEVNLKPADYDVDRYCASSGAGGQHVNRTASAIRLIHHETGIVVKCVDERSQHKNLAKAIKVLKSRIYDFYQQRDAQARASERKTLVGSGDRSQRIRTYNFPDNRVTDHRINFTVYKLDQVMLGAVHFLTDALIDYDRQQHREAMGDDDL